MSTTLESVKNEDLYEKVFCEEWGISQEDLNELINYIPEWSENDE